MSSLPNMLIAGLVSITFRSLGPQEIIRLALKSGVQAIEWGGDIHVPAGDVNRAREVGRMTREAELMVAAYGSYYRVGGEDQAPFESVLATAEALGAPTIRVWAGTRPSADHTFEERQKVIADAVRITQMAARSGITVCLEYHDGTLTDTPASVRQLLDELAGSEIEFLWQPAHGESVEANVSRLIDVLPRLRNVHVFYWWPDATTRHPLSEGEANWRAYIDIIRETGRTVDFLLEFAAGDSPEQFLADATTLRRWLKS